MKRIDIFPAVIRLSPENTVENLDDFGITGDAPQGTRKLDRCRAVILNGSLMVVVDSPSGPSLVFQEKITEEKHEKKVSKVRTVTNKVIAITKDQNCGCGSRLRGWNPYGNVVGSSFDPVD